MLEIKWHQMYISRHKDKNYDLVAKIFMTFKTFANELKNISPDANELLPVKLNVCKCSFMFSKLSAGESDTLLKIS